MYFGATRTLDVYFMTFTAANFLVFAFAVIFDTIGIPHLIKCKQERGDEAFRKLTGSIFSFSLVFSLGITVVFLLIMPILVRFMAAGFSSQEKEQVFVMAYYFVPWILMFFPYLALCSFYKSIKQFNIVFSAELMVSVAALISIIVFHTQNRCIPLAYFGGYCIGFIMLLVLSFKRFSLWGDVFNPQMRDFYKNFAQLFSANQVVSVYLMTERFIQSFLSAGGISILAYAGQITNNLSGLLTFRDIFIVPLSERQGRKDRLERILIALVMISAPVMFYVFFFAGDVVMLCFRHGKFDDVAAVSLTGALSVYALSLCPAIVALPGFRLFQVVDQIKNTVVVNIFNILGLLVFTGLFMFYYQMGIVGFSCAYVITTYLSTILTFYLLYRNVIAFDYLRIIKFLCFSSLLCFIVGFLLSVSRVPGSNAYVVFGMKTVVYFLLIIVGYWPLKARLLQIVGF